MVVFAVAITVVLVAVNLHHLKENKRPQPGAVWAKPSGETGLTFHIGLLPDVSINVFVNNQ